MEGELRSRFVAEFGELLARMVEGVVELHVPELKIGLDRGSDPFRFALIWAIGLGCLRHLPFRAEHGVTVPWELVCDWCASADLIEGFDGTFDWGAYVVGAFEGILPPPSEDDVERGWAASLDWELATTGAART